MRDQRRHVLSASRAVFVVASLTVCTMALAACASSSKNGGSSPFSSARGGTARELAQAYFDCLLEAYYFNGTGKGAIEKAVEDCQGLGEKYATKLVIDAGNPYIETNMRRNTYPIVERKGRRYLKQTVAG